MKSFRFYRDPDEIDAENDAAAKLDHATAQRRSIIRREPTIRPRRDQSTLDRDYNMMRHRQTMRQMHLQLNAENMRTDAQIARLETELQSLRRQREGAINRLERLRARTEAEDARSLSQNIPEARNTTTPEDPTLTPQQDSLPETEPSSQVLLPRPARESNLRFEMAATRPASPRADTTAMPSPPRSVSDNGRSRPVDGPLDNWDVVPSLSADFAPARRARAAIDQAEATIAATRATIREMTDREQPGLETPPPETWENSYPPLRRVPHMSPRPLPRTSVDGLGDRHRSASPDSETHEESTWNNLLSTMEHSNGALSASTSFASVPSNLDFTSSARSSSYRSHNSQSTSTSFGEIGSSSEETCDLPPGITEDDVRMIRERHRQTARRLPRRRTAGRISEPDVDSELLDIATNRGWTPIGLPGNNMSRLLMDQVLQRYQRDDDGTHALPPSHAIDSVFERMRRREHIPDEMWALVGLSSDDMNQYNSLRDELRNHI